MMSAQTTQSAIGTFEGLSFRDGEVGAIMENYHTGHAPGTITVPVFWSKADLLTEQENRLNSAEGMPVSEADEKTLNEISVALDKIEAITPEMVESLNAAIGEDLSQQFANTGIGQRLSAVINPENLSFSTDRQKFPHLGTVIRELGLEDDPHLGKSVIFNAVGREDEAVIGMVDTIIPGYPSEAVQHQREKGFFTRLGEAVGVTDFEPVATNS